MFSKSHQDNNLEAVIRHYPALEKIFRQVQSAKVDEQKYRDKIGYVPEVITNESPRPR